MEKKNVYKNMTDAAAFVAIVFAAFLVFVNYSGFKPDDMYEHFYDVKETAVYIRAAFVFLISLVANIFSRRSPFIGLAFSLLPLWYLLNCFSAGALTGDPMVYIILAAVHFSGALIYACHWVIDGENSYTRALTCAITAAMLSVTYFGILLLNLLDESYERSLFYLRIGFIACSLLCSGAGLLKHSRIEKGSKLSRIALAATAIGAFFGLETLFCEMIF